MATKVWPATRVDRVVPNQQLRHLRHDVAEVVAVVVDEDRSPYRRRMDDIRFNDRGQAPRTSRFSDRSCTKPEAM